jgi:HK97 family phage major capsid protein
MELEKQVQEQLNGIKTNLDASVEKVKSDLEQSIKQIKEAADKATPDQIKKVVEEQTKTINDALKQIQEWKSEREKVDPLNQEAINKMLSELKDINKNTQKKGKKTFEEVFNEAVEKDFDQIAQVSKRRGHVIELKGVDPMSFKSVGNMTLSGNLTGDSVISYSQMNAYLPPQQINLRDLVRTVFSDTGTYVHYRESAGEGSIGQQTEGSAKSQIDFDLTEVKTVNKYYSGFTRFSKQLAKSLPFFQGTLPTLLMREFFKEENDQMKSLIAAANGASTTTSETDDIKQIIDYIANLRTANYNPSYVIISHATKASLDKLTYLNGYYQGSGGVLSGVPGGTTRISDVPVVPVSWMNDSKVLIFDRDYVERVECESLRVEFFEQDGDNVTKNLITARIECYEEINPMTGSAILYGNL